MADYYVMRFSPFLLEDKKLTASAIMEMWRNEGFAVPNGFEFQVDDNRLRLDDQDDEFLDEYDDWNGMFNNRDKIVSFLQSIMSAKGSTDLRIKDTNDSTDCVEKYLYHITKTKVTSRSESYNPDD